MIETMLLAQAPPHARPAAAHRHALPRVPRPPTLWTRLRAAFRAFARPRPNDGACCP